MTLNYLKFTGEDIEFTVDGELIFPDEIGQLPSESCLMIRLKDVTRADAFSDILSETNINIGGKLISSEAGYYNRLFLVRPFFSTQFYMINWKLTITASVADWMKKLIHLFSLKYRQILNLFSHSTMKCTVL